MRNIFVFFTFIIFTSSTDLNILKIIEDNIDDNVSPCDNFYRHSCAKDKPAHEVMYTLLPEYHSKILMNYKLPDNLNFIGVNNSIPLFDEILKNRNQTNKIAQISHDYLERCLKNDTSTMKYIIQQLQSSEAFSQLKFENLIFDRNCSRASSILRKNLQREWYQKTENMTEISNGIESLIINVRSKLWLSNNSHIFDLHKAFFEELKFDIIKQIENSTWLKSAEMIDAFKTLAKQLHFEECPMFDRNLTDLVNSYKKCKSDYKIESLTILCYFKLQPGWTRNMAKLNAYNYWHSAVCLYHSVMSIVNNETIPGIFYGISGSTFTHEIGHTLVKSSQDRIFVPDSLKSFKNCVQEQFNKTCSFFNEKICETHDYQFDENGSDIFGHPFAFDMLKKKHGEKINEVVDGSKYNLTNAQIFFYATNYMDCSRKASESIKYEPHHASVARVNAAIIQVQDFQKIFKCDSNSRMMKSKTEQCYLFGKP